MVLFISYASEDQADFVRPLAEALSKEYEKVWYAEYELTLGDSLLQKINAGLASCDFGIVVLSKPFFEKKWPRAELDGLFALETNSRKIILPIWKDITEEEVKTYSPILAGRLAISTTAGLPKVLEEIRMAVSVSERQQKFTAVDVAAQRVQSFRQNVADRRRVERLLASEEGAAIVLAGVGTLWQTIQDLLSTGASDSDPVKFSFARNAMGHMYASTVRGMYLGIRAVDLHSNGANSMVLETKIFRKNFDRFGQLQGSNDFDLVDIDFKPTFGASNALIWIKTETSEESGISGGTYRTEELAGHLVDLFLTHVDEAINNE
jgi:hypothetical protein